MKRTLKPIFPPAGIEREYEKRLKKAVREMEHSVVYWLRAKYRANESRIVGDSATDDLLKAFRKLLHQWERNFRELADVLPRWFVSKIRGYVAGNLAQQTKPLKDSGLGFNLKFSYMSQRERQTFQAIVKENVNLIKSIARESLTQVEGIVLRNIEAGHDLARMTEDLHKQFGVTERRARMIARDQTNKATNNLSRQRLLSYGINKGIWMHTASGKTYRETHALDHTQGGMDGAEYFIDEGCYDPNPNVQDYIQPGELVNCYCVCRPVIPQLSEEETEQGIEEILQEVENTNRNYDSAFAQAIGKEHYDGLRNIVDASNDVEAVAVWNRFEDKINILDAKYAETAHFDPTLKGIKFDIATIAKGDSIHTPYQTAFHEAAHLFDALNAPKYRLSFSSSFGMGAEQFTGQSSFVSAIKKDVAKLVRTKYVELKASGKTSVADVYVNISRDLRKYSAREIANVADILEGATKGKIYTGYGHGAEYWKQHTLGSGRKKNEYGLSEEAFAEMFDSVLSNPEALEKIKRFFPSAYKVFRQMLKTLEK